MSLSDKFLRDLICEEIDQKGSIALDKFINHCLYNPEYGYYNKNKIIGKDGDFITSPEISQMFGELILISFIYQWENSKKPKEFNLIELGPGNGTLMLDMLKTAKKYPNFFSKLNPILFEKSSALKKIQRKLLSEFNCIWVNSFDKINQKPSFIVANEFLDSFPIKQIVSRNGNWYENVILHKNRNFYFGIGEKIIDQNLPNAIPDGKIIEISMQSDFFFSKLLNLISLNGLSLIIIDYGKITEDYPIGNTLQGVRKHKAASIFDNLGETDITSLVNFKRLVNKISPNIRVQGPITQKEYLYNLGIKDLTEKISLILPVNERRGLLSSFERLVSNKHMGQVFKVLGLSNFNFSNLPGFN